MRKCGIDSSNPLLHSIDKGTKFMIVQNRIGNNVDAENTHYFDEYVMADGVAKQMELHNLDGLSILMNSSFTNDPSFLKQFTGKKDLQEEPETHERKR